MSTTRHIGALAVGTFAVALGLAQGGCSSADPGLSSEITDQTSEAVDTICNKAAPASLDGFPVYPYCGNFDVWTSNGIDTRSSSGGAGWTKTEGGYGYQCVEWAVRYFYFKWNVPHGWPVAYAKDMCATHPAGVTTTSTPVHGDLIVFGAGSCGADSTAGHVAAIDTVSASTVGVVQQNPAGKGSFNKSCAKCFLHAAANTGVVAPPPPPVDAGSKSDAGTSASDDAASDARSSADGSPVPAAPPPEGIDASDTDGGGSSDAPPTWPGGEVSGCSVARAPGSARGFGWLLVGLCAFARRRR